jgi:hypothetical protein
MTTLRDVLLAAAAEAGVEGADAPDGGVTWSREGRPYCVLEPGGESAAFRLDDVLAAAARRTPDTATSPLGAAWVEFRPATLDGHAIDRATAWFAAAVRRAG